MRLFRSILLLMLVASAVPSAVLLTAISDASLREVDGFETPDAVLEKPFKRRTIEKALEKATRGG